MEKNEEIDSSTLYGAISVLREAVETLLASDEQIDGTTDEELEDAIQHSFSPEIIKQASAILVARNALRLTGYLNRGRTDSTKNMPKASGFYLGIDCLGKWLVEHVEGEVITKEVISDWCSNAWSKHILDHFGRN